jgi:hypothetical protein
VANVLLNAVLSHTPGNFLAEKTLKTSLKQHARIGALFLLILGAPVSRGVPSGGPTLTKENLKLRSHTVSVESRFTGRGIRTEKVLLFGH